MAKLTSVKFVGKTFPNDSIRRQLSQHPTTTTATTIQPHPMLAGRMASLATACRLSARATAGRIHNATANRAFRTSSTSLAAQNFTMPAMSPTMTEGNIASWKVKEGDTFTTGDVLLEIETDKAQMDVEAQDDGVMAKITQPDGSKSVKVGTRIAIIAEPDDDLSTLSLPAEDSAPTSSPKEDMASGVDQSKSSEAQAEATPESSPSDTPKSSSPTKQTYPLYPSVQHLLRENRLDSSEADKIPASGPQGRLLKGDVLAYLGIIPSSYPSTLSERVSKLSHLDLSNVKGSTPKKADVSQPFSAVTPPSSLQPEPPLATEIAVPVSLDAVLTVQKRIEDTLGVHLPLSVFIARATDVANDDLPRPKTAVPTNNELFDQVLGLNKVAITGNASRGHYMPQITALPGSTPPAIAPRAVSRPQQLNVYDILAGKSSNKLFAAGPALRRGGIAAGSRASTNIFSVTASVGEERRARVFLERVKTILEKEPGRLVL